MKPITIKDICTATNGTLICGNASDTINNVTSDSRKATDGSLFIPLQGERDGHDFIDSAFENGAIATLTQKDIPVVDGRSVIKVENVHDAFGALAKYYKQLLNVPTVSVIGSVGKTTTKDMLSGVLSQKYNTQRTNGNYNNDIGVPITVFTLEEDTEAAVIELGMSGFGEIDYLANIVRPNIVVMTNIGVSHIEKLKSRENIFKAKMEYTKYFNENNLIIANGDDDFIGTIKSMGLPCKVLYYGLDSTKNDIFAKNIVNKGLKGLDFTIVYDGKEYPASIIVPGVHNVYNALASFLVGMQFNIAPENILKGLVDFERTGMRLNTEDKDGIITINDCYNAAPNSIMAGLRVLKSESNRTRYIAVLGDVLELGDYSRSEHEKVGEFIAELGLDVLITAGENSAYMSEKAKTGVSEVYAYKTTTEAAQKAKEIIRPGDIVLIKASRGMGFEEVYKTIREND